MAVGVLVVRCVSRIETHLPVASDSQTTVIGKGKSGPPRVSTTDLEFEPLLMAQRSAVASSREEHQAEPRVGDVWTSHAQWSMGAEQGLAAMLVVVRAFNEAWSSQPLFDVAPISEDERLASEWSLILSASDSGLGLPLVVHIDVQSTTTSSMLDRRLGSLAEPARDDLLVLLRAYALSDASAIELRVAQSGTVSIRLHPEWDEFSRQLVALSHAFSAMLEVERAKHASVDSSENADDRCERLLVAASGAQWAIVEKESCKWEYREVRPFVYCSGSQISGIPHRLGEAVACLYLGSTVKGVQRTASQRLDREAFQRLKRFFDLPLTRLCQSADPWTAFQLVVGSAEAKTVARADIRVIVESIRVAKLATGVAAGTPTMKLAARRPTGE